MERYKPREGAKELGKPREAFPCDRRGMPSDLMAHFMLGYSRSKHTFLTHNGKAIQ